MFILCSKKHCMKLSGNYSTCLLRIRNPYAWFSSNATEQPSLTVDYLINKCGLTPESAVKASQKINFKSITKADSVLAVLNRYGFTKTCISKLISKDPRVLSFDPKKTLEPRIEIFSNMGFSGRDLGKIFWKDPSVLACANLEDRILTSIDFLKSFLEDDKSVSLAFSRLRWIKDIQAIMEPNIELLLNQGVTKFGISKLILRRPQLLTWRTSQLNQVILKAKEMGFDPSKLMFIPAICTLSQMSQPKLEAKREIFRSFGWSEDEIHCIFRKMPHCLSASEKAIRNRLNFFMNKHGWTAAEIAHVPVILLLSMEKRIAPRYYVIQVLLSQGLMKKQSINTALRLTEDKFLEKFIIKYHQELPQLLKEYKCNME